MTGARIYTVGLYKSLTGVIHMCCTVWGETTNLNLEKLCKLQKRAARIILNAKYDILSLQLF